MLSPDSGETQVSTMYGRFHCLQNDLITEQLLKYSAHTRNELAMLKSFIRPGDSILDIGAHIGTFSVPFAVFAGKEGKVFSFEANAKTFKLLAKNIAENGLDDVISPMNAVVAERDGVEFSALLPDGGNSGMYYFSPAQDPDSNRVKSINISAWRDRDFPGAKFNLVKIDVEGAELAVLRSCSTIISSGLPMLYIEMARDALWRFDATFVDIEAILTGYGYHYFRNVGARNSNNDEFVLARIDRLQDGGNFFDVLAIHPTDARYPKKFLSGLTLGFYYKREALLAAAKRLVGR